jgi:crotonobetainyl-CoA:carnitine CoA-transferase CaiB-like acyl-CoA transferase
VACAALEQKFWDRLVELVGLDDKFRDDVGQEQAVIAAVGAVFAAHDADHWSRVLEGEDVCTTVVATWDEAVAAGLVDVDAPERVSVPDGQRSFPTLPSPLAPALRRSGDTLPYPALAELPSSSAWH